MADEILLTAQLRELIGKQVKQLRRDGMIPAVVYGSQLLKPLSLKIEEKALMTVVAKAGRNRLIRLGLDGEQHMVLTRQVQRNPITGRLIHVDFQEVSMTEKITSQVPLALVGSSPAVTRGEGLLIHGIDVVEIRALPTDLPPSIEVDVSGLTDLEQAITVGNLKVSDKIEILTSRDEMVAKVVPVKEEVITEEVPAAAAAEVEVIGKGKKEEEVPEAGAVATEAKKEEKK
jgi:large subunit ribosomal protein L25